MQTVGSYLRELRAARGVSLEEIARVTRVGQGYLQALESDAFDRLPAPVFTKGFVRAYCQALGQPADEALSRYGEILKGAAPEPALTVTLRPKARGRAPTLVSLALLLALGLGLFLLTLGLEGRLKGTSGPSRPTREAVKDRGAATSPVKPPASGEPGRVRLVARATEPTWVRVQTDDGTVVQELLPAGATREWVSSKRFVVTIGNAGGLALELNGQPIPPLGARGAVIQNLIIPAPEAAKP